MGNGGKKRCVNKLNSRDCTAVHDDGKAFHCQRPDLNFKLLHVLWPCLQFNSMPLSQGFQVFQDFSRPCKSVLAASGA
jgi:hypothetical protein